MSGVAVSIAGDAEQRRWYFDRVAAGPTWTFFALTEPGKGSAASELEATLVPDGDSFLVHGQKRYVGNAVHASVGVVFCRRRPGPWGIEAALIDTADPGYSAELLPVTGLRGARISAVRLDGVRVPRERVLGLDRSLAYRGIACANRTLVRFRPVLAAMALGLARSVVDYVGAARPQLGGTARLRLHDVSERISAAGSRTFEEAAAVDAGEPNRSRIAAVKSRAAQLAEEVTILAAELLGPGSLMEHPWLDKVYRDARAFELMEGTGQIQQLAICEGVLRGSFFGRDDDLDYPGSIDEPATTQRP
jgi:alkylation response protein AidB-like acyl-CoA dehydrogenase